LSWRTESKTDVAGALAAVARQLRMQRDTPSLKFFCSAAPAFLLVMSTGRRLLAEGCIFRSDESVEILAISPQRIITFL
jgi:hypothetical protein